MAEKRYYWLKLKEDYFNSPKIKKLRKIAGGDTFTIIYLKMQLLSIRNEGVIQFEGIEPTFEEELALKLDEDLDNVKLTLAYLQSQCLYEINENNECLLIEANNNIGSEGQSAERVRNFREKKKNMEIELENQAKSLQCNGGVTEVKRSSISISNSISLYKEEEEIFNHYNSKKIVNHKEMTEEIRNSISKALKKYSVEQLKTYIDRYHRVISDKNYFFSYTWSLKDLLNRKDGISSFTDEGSKWIDYCNKVGIKANANQEEKKNYIVDKNGVFSLNDR